MDNEQIQSEVDKFMEKVQKGAPGKKGEKPTEAPQKKKKSATEKLVEATQANVKKKAEEQEKSETMPQIICYEDQVAISNYVKSMPSDLPHVKVLELVLNHFEQLENTDDLQNLIEKVLAEKEKAAPGLLSKEALENYVDELLKEDDGTMTLEDVTNKVLSKFPGLQPSTWLYQTLVLHMTEQKGIKKASSHSEFASLSAAINKAKPWDVIHVEPGPIDLSAIKLGFKNLPTFSPEAMEDIEKTFNVMVETVKESYDLEKLPENILMAQKEDGTYKAIPWPKQEQPEDGWKHHTLYLENLLEGMVNELKQYVEENLLPGVAAAQPPAASKYQPIKLPPPEQPEPFKVPPSAAFYPSTLEATGANPEPEKDPAKYFKDALGSGAFEATIHAIDNVTMKDLDVLYYQVEGNDYKYKLAKGILMHLKKSWKGDPEKKLALLTVAEPALTEEITVCYKHEFGLIMCSLNHAVSEMLDKLKKEYNKGKKGGKGDDSKEHPVGTDAA